MFQDGLLHTRRPPDPQTAVTEQFKLINEGKVEGAQGINYSRNPDGTSFLSVEFNFRSQGLSDLFIALDSNREYKRFLEQLAKDGRELKGRMRSGHRRNVTWMELEIQTSA